jgi:hypothetical protein
MSDKPQWPREIWMREREDYDQGVVSAVLSELATIARYEGDTERDADFHRYVDGDIYDSAEKYHVARIEALTAERDALAAELDAAHTEIQDKEASVDYWHQESRIQYESKEKARAERDALAEKLAKAVRCLEFIGCEENEEGSLARKALAAIKEGGE